MYLLYLKVAAVAYKLSCNLEMSGALVVNGPGASRFPYFTNRKRESL